MPIFNSLDQPAQAVSTSLGIAAGPRPPQVGRASREGKHMTGLMANRSLRAFLIAQNNQRKLRLFAAACCRSIAAFIVQEQSWQAIAVAERFADGHASQQELDEAFAHAPEEAASVAAYVAYREASVAATAASERSRLVCATFAPNEEELVAVTQHLVAACIFGRGAAAIPTPSELLVKMAQRAYNERELPSGFLPNYRLAMLADELELEGQRDQVVLDHLRDPGPHVRGCFALDWVLRSAPAQSKRSQPG
ncbi:MAG: hypothetical protein AB7K24_25160 [Gemmataceae bacterium]